MVVALWTADALACGGFFCNNVDPVDQTGETIVFDVDDGTITTHARIQFEGSAEDFAWVLPVPGVPELFLSTRALFDALEVRTAPVPVLNRTFEEGCERPMYTYDLDYGAYSTSSSGGVSVLATPTVGPYQGVVLDAVSEEALTAWLTDNGFGIPSNFGEAAGPYLAGGMNFLALKLAKETDTGDLPPLGVKWVGDRPSVPLTLTAVAAQPNLPLTVYVLGEHRAVPLTYLHVQMNPLVYDWFGRGRNWLEMVGRAADEAGGQAFATTYAGAVPQQDLGCSQMSVDGLADLTVAVDWWQGVQSSGFTASEELLNVLRRQVPAPPGVSEQDFYNSPEGYAAEWAALDVAFDSVAATADLDESVRVPCLDAEQILSSNAYVTRLTSTISPEEMTVDPEFGFNPDLPDVSNVVEGELHERCDGTAVLSLPGGYELVVGEVDDQGYPSEEWVLARLGFHAIVVERTSESGQPEILADHRDSLVGDAVLVDEGAGCGCDGTSAGWLAVAPFVALLVRRRR